MGARGNAGSPHEGSTRWSSRAGADFGFTDFSNTCRYPPGEIDTRLRGFTHQTTGELSDLKASQTELSQSAQGSAKPGWSSAVATAGLRLAGLPLGRNCASCTTLETHHRRTIIAQPNTARLPTGTKAFGTSLLANFAYKAASALDSTRH